MLKVSFTHSEVKHNDSTIQKEQLTVKQEWRLLREATIHNLNELDEN